MTDQNEMIIQQLKNRIGQIVSQYEEELARLGTQASTMIQERDDKIAELSGDKE